MIFSLFSTITGVKATNSPAIGSKAPTPKSITHEGKPFDFAEAYTKGLTLVFFYPKADTPGCTKQACSLRDEYEKLQDLGIQVIGVSKDTPQDQAKFREKYHLPYTLIADKDGKVIEAFGTGSMIGMSKRRAFLIKDGSVVWLDLNASTSKQAQDVLNYMAKK
ncbi:MAG: peroxiredoxin [Verrucomicrobiota bacterium]